VSTPNDRPSVPRPTISYRGGWTDRIPDELKQRHQWVLWLYEWRSDKKGGGKWTKPPFQPIVRGRGWAKAENDNPATWTSCRKVLETFRAHANVPGALKLDGIGYVFSADDDLIGVDFDHCLDTAGTIAPWAGEWLRRLGPTYAEVSPSGDGLKAWYRAAPLPPKGKSNGRRRGGYGDDQAGEIELYDRGRFFTTTGRIWWPDQPAIAAADPDALAELVAELDAGRNGPKGKGKARAGKIAEPAATLGDDLQEVDPRRKSYIDALSDSDLLAWASRAKNGAKFSALFSGDTSGYPSGSEADAALLAILAFWTGGDAERMERLFGGSELARRGKWIDRAGYREVSIGNAIRLNAGNSPDLADFEVNGSTVTFKPKAPPERPRWQRPQEAPAPGANGSGNGKHNGAPTPPAAGEAKDEPENAAKPDDKHRAGDKVEVAANKADDDPNRLARLFLEEHCKHPDGPTLVFWQGEFHRWDAGAYRPVEESEINAELNAACQAELEQANVRRIAEWEKNNKNGPGGRPSCKPTAVKVGKQLVGNVSQSLTGQCMVKGKVAQPSWLTPDPPFPATDVLPCRNGLVHLPTLVEGRNGFHAPTPLFFSPYCLAQTQH
jgi:hypothetical protein